MASKAAQGMPVAHLSGKTIAFTGKLNRSREQLAPLIKSAGGKVVEQVSEKLDYLVTGSTRTGNPSAAENKARQLIQKKNAPIQIVDESDFLALFTPGRDEVIALLKKGGAGVASLGKLVEMSVPMPDLSGADLRGLQLPAGHVDFQSFCLDGADLREATLSGVYLPKLHNVRLDNALLKDAGVFHLEDCSVKNADLAGARLNPAVFTIPEDY